MSKTKKNVQFTFVWQRDNWICLVILQLDMSVKNYDMFFIISIFIG